MPSPPLPPPPQESLRAKSFYVGDAVTETARQVVRMGGAVDTKAPGQAPPDLPSLLLDGRICYIGMPVGSWGWRVGVGWGCVWWGGAWVLVGWMPWWHGRPLAHPCFCLQTAQRLELPCPLHPRPFGVAPSSPAHHFPLPPLLQLVPQVTELVISELLWLNYAAPDKPVYVYINSTGGWVGGWYGGGGSCAGCKGGHSVWAS